MNEIWKPLKDFPNYEVSNLGRVRNKRNGKIRATFHNNCGYVQLLIGVRKLEDGKKVRYVPLVHRLVAEAFIPNPDPTKYTQINHKDENKDNNEVSNLEWVAAVQNINYGTRNSRHAEYIKNMPAEHRKKLSDAAKKRASNEHPKNRKVVLTCLETKEAVEYPSVRAAARFLGVNFSKVHYHAGQGTPINGYSVEKKD